MDNSPFTKLAAELRNKIWELSLGHDEAIKIETDIRYDTRAAEISLVPPPAQNVKNITALVKTCKQIRRECALLFFHVNAFDFGFFFSTYLTKSAQEFRNQIGDSAFAAIKDVTFTFITRIPPKNRWASDFLDDSKKAKGFAESAGVPRIGIRVVFGLYKTNFAFVIKLQDWERSWNSTAIALQEEIESAQDFIDKKYLQEFEEYLPSHKEQLKKLRNV